MNERKLNKRQSILFAKIPYLLKRKRNFNPEIIIVFFFYPQKGNVAKTRVGNNQ